MSILLKKSIKFVQSKLPGSEVHGNCLVFGSKEVHVSEHDGMFNLNIFDNGNSVTNIRDIFATDLCDFLTNGVK